MKIVRDVFILMENVKKTVFTMKIYFCIMMKQITVFETIEKS